MHLRTFAFVFALAGVSATAQETERIKERAADALEATKDTVKSAANALAQSTRQAWRKTKAYLSDDPDTYRRGADQKLNELGAEIATLRKNSAGLKERTYFLTRIDALEQQHKYAANQLAALPPEEVRKGRDGMRRRVDVLLEHLDDYVDLAQREAKDFTTLP